MKCNKAYYPLLWGQDLKEAGLPFKVGNWAPSGTVLRSRHSPFCLWLLVAAAHLLRPQVVEELPGAITSSDWV